MNIFAVIYEHVDKISAQLLGFTGILAGVTFVTLSNLTAAMTILAASTTVLYNIIKIYRERKR